MAQDVASLYAVRRDKATPYPEPSLRCLPSLYEIALATHMPSFLARGADVSSLPPELRGDFLELLPLDLPLEDAFSIVDEGYWGRRLLRTFPTLPKLPPLPAGPRGRRPGSSSAAAPADDSASSRPDSRPSNASRQLAAFETAQGITRIADAADGGDDADDAGEAADAAGIGGSAAFGGAGRPTAQRGSKAAPDPDACGYRRLFFEMLISRLASLVACTYTDTASPQELIEPYSGSGIPQAGAQRLADEAQRRGELEAELYRVAGLGGAVVRDLSLTLLPGRVDLQRLVGLLPNLQSLVLCYDNSAIDYHQVLAANPQSLSGSYLPPDFYSLEAGDSLVVRSRTLSEAAKASAMVRRVYAVQAQMEAAAKASRAADAGGREAAPGVQAISGADDAGLAEIDPRSVAFPFHVFPDTQKMALCSFREPAVKTFDGQAAVAVSASRVGVTREELLSLAKMLKACGPALHTLALRRSHLGDDGAGVLAKGLDLATGHKAPPAREAQGSVDTPQNQSFARGGPSFGAGTGRGSSLFKKRELSPEPEDPDSLFYLTRLDLSYNEVRDQACQYLAKLFVIITPEDLDERREKQRREKAAAVLQAAEDELAARRSEVERLEAAARVAAEEAAREEAALREAEEREREDGRPGAEESGVSGRTGPAALAAQEAQERLERAREALQKAEQAVELAASDLDRPALVAAPEADREKASLRPRPAVSQLVLAGNLIGNGGCALLGRALGQRGSRLEILDLSATNVGNEGLILLANGILKASAKYQTRTLLRLSLASCPLTLGRDTVKVLSRLISRTGLRELDVSGCLLEGETDAPRDQGASKALQASQALAASSTSISGAVLSSQVESAGEGAATASSSPEALALGRQLSEALQLRYKMCYDEAGARIPGLAPCLLWARGCGLGREAEAMIQRANMQAEGLLAGRRSERRV